MRAMGHQSRYCNTQHAHVSTDEFEQAPDGYPYYPQSDYYDSYNNDAYTNYSNAYQQEQEDIHEHEAVKGESTLDRDFKLNGQSIGFAKRKSGSGQTTLCL